MLRVCIVALTLCVPQLAQAAKADILWTEPVDDCQDSALREHPAGGVVLAGIAFPDDDGVNSRLCVLHVDADGATRWSRQIFVRNAPHVAADLALDADGDVFVAYTITEESVIDGKIEIERELWLAKFSSTGAPLWNEPLSPTGGNVSATALAVDADGGARVATRSVGIGVAQAGVVAVDPFGTTAWSYAHDGGAAPFRLEGLGLDAAGDAFFTDGFDVVKLGHDGDVRWSAPLPPVDAEGDGDFAQLAMTAAGPVVLFAGGTAQLSADSGDLLWHDEASGDALVVDETDTITTVRRVALDDGAHLEVVSLEPSGATRWAASFADRDGAYLIDVHARSSRVAVSGWSNGASDGFLSTHKGFVFVLDDRGDELWRYTESRASMGQLLLASDGDVYVATDIREGLFDPRYTQKLRRYAGAGKTCAWWDLVCHLTN